MRSNYPPLEGEGNASVPRNLFSPLTPPDGSLSFLFRAVAVFPIWPLLKAFNYSNPFVYFRVPPVTLHKTTVAQAQSTPMQLASQSSKAA